MKAIALEIARVNVFAKDFYVIPFKLSLHSCLSHILLSFSHSLAAPVKLASITFYGGAKSGGGVPCCSASSAEVGKFWVVKKKKEQEKKNLSPPSKKRKFSKSSSILSIEHREKQVARMVGTSIPRQSSARFGILLARG